MSSYPIKWHEECLKNSKVSEERLSNEINRIHKQLCILREENCFRAFQINEARRIGKKSFDSGKFRKSSQSHGREKR